MYKPEARCVQKTGGLAVFAYSVPVYVIVKLLVKIMQENYVTIWEFFQIMLPGGGTMVAFFGRILTLGQ